LRNLGGLIVIDFIDMEKKSNREKVFTTLKEALTKDKAKTHVLKMSELGLIEMTRKRTRENLNRFLSEPCFYCEGRGSLKTKRTICYEILRDLERETTMAGQAPQILVHAHPDIARVLKEEEQQSVIDLERRINRRVIILEKENLHIEQYEISS
jgi:ribonuclease G